MDIKQPTPEQLRETIKRHGLTRADACKLVHVSLKAWHNWSAPETSQNHRSIPLPVWELLLLRLGDHPTHQLVDRVKLAALRAKVKGAIDI